MARNLLLIFLYCYLRQAFNLVVLFWLFCGSMLLLLSLTVVNDESVVQKSVKDSLLRRFSLSGVPDYNPIHSPDLHQQTLMADDNPPSTSLIGGSEVTEKITLEYEIFHSNPQQKTHI